MNLTEKLLLFGSLILALSGYYLGKHVASVPSVKTDTKIDQTDVTDTHQQETITETKKPDGTDTTVTTINTVKDQTDKTDTDTKTQVTTTKPKINLSLLAATSIHEPFGPPTYGLSVSKEFLGPITVGAFGLTNGTIGVSVGVNF